MKTRLAALILIFITGFLHAAEDERPIVDTSKLSVEKIPNTSLPTLHIVGDSTVRGGGSGTGIVGWGERITPFFNTNKINVINDAIGGRSARTYFDEGRWARVAASLKPGDFVIIQFGHNDQGRIGDPANKHRADGRGIGPETVEDTLPDGTTEAVHTFGWYMARFAADTKSRGATAIICSPIPHKQRWENSRDFPEIAEWDAEVATNNDAIFIDLTLVVTDSYKKIGMQKVETLFADKGTHTTDAGARLNAGCVIAALKGLKTTSALTKYLSDKAKDIQPCSPPSQTISKNAPATP